ncbi:MAG TPA: hypothetical protein VGY66_20030 [Gemmataceae bacterium]|nr:hypothetical protein [Gemmataceae bacterium]
MFAGAAREAVFSKPEVIRRINAEFIPVALKAALVNWPPIGDEGLLYREIARSKIAPQGICVVNSAGKVLNWATMFDDDKSVLAFLDHARERFAKYPDAQQPVATERHLKFPSEKLEDTEDTGKALPAPDRHPGGQRCPAAAALPRGTVVARLIGRAFDKDGKPVADTVRQENYVEDRFHIGVDTQERLAKALENAATGRVKIPNEFARQCVMHAYLGVLDVQPLDNPGGSRGNLTRCEFWAEKVDKSKTPTLWRIEGESHVSIDQMANGGPGDLHEVRLIWYGYVGMDRERVSRLVLTARGKEKLKFGLARGEHANEAASLPAGHRIDMACEVRYGILGAPAAADQVTADAPAPPLGAPPLEVPEQARRQIMDALGLPFLVFRDKVLQELRLSNEQRQSLEERLLGTVQDTMQFFQNLGDKQPEEREKALHSYRQKAQQKLAVFLKQTLKDNQLKRLRQLELQQQGPFALGQPDLAKELKITVEQRQQFAGVVQEMEKKIHPLLKEAQSGGNPEEIRPKVLQIRKDHAGKIESILNDTQKKQWKELLGQELALDD